MVRMDRALWNAPLSVCVPCSCLASPCYLSHLHTDYSVHVCISLNAASRRHAHFLLKPTCQPYLAHLPRPSPASHALLIYFSVALSSYSTRTLLSVCNPHHQPVCVSPLLLSWLSPPLLSPRRPTLILSTPPRRTRLSLPALLSLLPGMLLPSTPMAPSPLS